MKIINKKWVWICAIIIIFIVVGYKAYYQPIHKLKQIDRIGFVNEVMLKDDNFNNILSTAKFKLGSSIIFKPELSGDVYYKNSKKTTIGFSYNGDNIIFVLGDVGGYYILEGNNAMLGKSVLDDIMTKIK